jgi:hypothetical protein
MSRSISEQCSCRLGVNIDNYEAVHAHSTENSCDATLEDLNDEYETAASDMLDCPNQRTI